MEPNTKIKVPHDAKRIAVMRPNTMSRKWLVTIETKYGFVNNYFEDEDAAKRFAATVKIETGCNVIFI